MKLSQFWDELNRHDWYYDFSDDFSVWKRGSDRDKELRVMANESPAHQELMDKFSKHYFSGKPWGTDKAPKPERPQEGE